MNELDELQQFITDCEFKTRKILRESNKRRKDTARLLAARDRVDRLKHRGGKSELVKSTKTKSLTKAVELTPNAEKSKLPASSDKVAPAKIWKEQDKIIHDACETIKSLDKTTSKGAPWANSSYSKAGKCTNASLHASPFVGSKKSSQDYPTKAKPDAKHASSNVDSDDDGAMGNGEPAMVTRRTIERDFYIMSKRRNKPLSKRPQRSGKDLEQTPELKSSVLWKKYRCEDRIMEAKTKRAERFYNDFEHLQNLDDEADDVKTRTDYDKSDSESSTSDIHEDDYAHAIHDLVESHVAGENYRSQRRSDKALLKICFQPNVRDMWNQLAQHAEGIGAAAKEEALSECSDPSEIKECQVPSVPLQIATKKFDFHIVGGTKKENDNLDNGAVVEHSRWISPYRQSSAKSHLIVNEPMETPLMNRSCPLTASISIIQHFPADKDSPPGSVIWLYEIYDPCNGGQMNFMLTESKFNTLNETLRHTLVDVSKTEKVEKMVHHQTVEHPDGTKRGVSILVTADGMHITCSIYRSKYVDNGSFEKSRSEEFDLICNLCVSEVLQLLEKHQNYSVVNKNFWLDYENGEIIWDPFIKILGSKSTVVEGDYCGHLKLLVSAEQSRLLSFSKKAHDSLLAFLARSKMVSSIDDIIQIFPDNVQSLDESYENSAPPLSMRISGQSSFSNCICPGQAIVGRRGMWRLVEPMIEEKTATMFPVWPSSRDIKYPEDFDKTQASSRFYYKDVGSQKGVSVTALSSLAFESPVLAPDCYAVDKGFSVPPYSEHETLDGSLPFVYIPCTSLMENPVQSRLDTLLPQPVVVLDPSASATDWNDAPSNECGQVYHCREIPQFDRNGFRATTFANRLEYDDSIPSLVYGISEKAAMPNLPTMSQMLTHTSIECCSELLSRKRTAIDYHYIAESTGEGTLNEPYLFSTHMSAYGSVYVSRKSISSYREQKRFLLAAKEAESKKTAIALKMKAAEEIAEARLKERISKIEQSAQDNVGQTQLDEVQISSAGATVQYGHDMAYDSDNSAAAHHLPAHIYSYVNKTPLNKRKVACDVELPDKSNESTCEDTKNDLESLAGALIDNPKFLRAIARKLGISEEQIMQTDQSMAHLKVDDTTKELNASKFPTIPNIHDRHAEIRQTSLTDTIANSNGQCQEMEMVVASHPSIMPKLKLNCKKYRSSNQIGLRDDGWRRLPRVETVIGQFSLTNKRVQSGWGGPKFRKMDEERSFIIVNSSDKLRYEIDSEQFVTKTTAMFIPDLTMERLRLSQLKRQQKKNEESILSMDQQRDLDEILHIPVSSTPPLQHGDIVEKKSAEEESGENIESETNGSAMGKENQDVDHVTKALLAVKNHNLPELEQALDIEAVPVETRDQHGNTLCILASQQGSKKLVKFLLRRGANINAKSNNGNTALHYLYEYGHTELAEYVMRKGADDSSRNNEGLTVYEGVHRENLSLI